MVRIGLKGVSETLLIPFYARVYGSLHDKEKFYDEVALAIFQKIDYDFSKFDAAKMSIWGCLARSVILDREAKQFLQEYPEATCISIGCGFDTRFDRIDNGKIHWYGIDFPEVIQFREQIFPKKERTKWIAKSALDKSWTAEIEEKNTEQVLIIIEGLLMYFQEKEVENLFQILTERFPKAIILAEFMRPFTVKYQKQHDSVGKTEAVFQWGISKSKDIEKLCSKINFLEEWNMTKEMLPFAPWQFRFLSPFFTLVNNSIVKMQIKKS